MKKIISVLLLLCLLCGCAAAPVPPAETTAPTAAAQSRFEDFAFPTEEGLPLLRLEFPALEEVGWISDLDAFGDGLLIGWYDAPLQEGGLAEDAPYHLGILDPDTGTFTCRQDLGTGSSFHIQVCEDTIAILKPELGNVTLLDSHLQKRSFYTVPRDLYSFRLDPTASWLYFCTEDNTLVRQELATGNREVLIEDAIDIYIDSSSGENITVCYVDSYHHMKYRLRVDLITGDLEYAPFPAGMLYTEYREGVWLALRSGPDPVYLLGIRNELLEVQDPALILSLIEGPAPLCVSGYSPSERQDYALYRDDGSLLASFVCPSSLTIVDQPRYSPARNGYFISAMEGEGKPVLLYLDASAGFSGPPLAMLPFQDPRLLPEGKAVSAQLYDRAAQLYQTYGVEIRIADQCALQYPGFTALPETDAETIWRGLDCLEEALSTYPEGFFRQLVFGDHQALQIDLTGALTAETQPENPEDRISFAGFVNHYNGRHMMVLDAGTYDLTQTIFHEVSHIIDSKLEFLSIYLDTMYSEQHWASLNPPGFFYAEDLYAQSDSFYTDGSDAYFIDPYACTFPTEDRARVMEYAMADFEWYFDPGNHWPLVEKLAYYSACIREAFICTDWPEVTPWEVPLNGYVYGTPVG